jgi:2-polyprenyl-3-methyl-5-hydroxy-6-metoxy-1,4-benzoquinol methylase
MKAPSCPKIYASVIGRVQSLGLPSGAKFLDAPCGDGEVSIELAKLGFEVSAVDMVDELLPEARAALGSCFRIADLTRPLPWPDASFDLILCVEGIEHVEDAFALLREMHRLLKPGGILIVTTPNIISLRSRMRFFGSGFYNCDPRPLDESARHPMHHIGLRTFPELRYFLQTSGFQLADVAATHTKPITYAYSVFAPWMWLYTLIAFRKEKSAAQRERNKEIHRTLLSSAILYGENLMLVSRKV